MSEYSGLADFYAVSQSQEFSRKYQFKIVTLGPLTSADLLYFTTATLPGKSVSNHPVPYMGVNFNIPGAVQYDGSAAWVVKFRADEAQNIRAKLLAWQDDIFSFKESGGKYGVPVETATVALLGKSPKETLRTYDLKGIWPQKVADLQYNITDKGAVQEFDVTFAYQYWEEV